MREERSGNLIQAQCDVPGIIQDLCQLTLEFRKKYNALNIKNKAFLAYL
jgi:hypothetical protein